jgi:hypothetical protein
MIKLTDILGQTYNNTQWDTGVTHTAPGEGSLCSSGWIHAYPTDNVVLALMLNPIHANFKPVRAWEAIGSGRSKSDGLKIGYESVTVLREVAIPDITVEQIARFAICCALQVYKEESFCRWANCWLSGKDGSAWATEAEAGTEAGTAAWAAMWAAEAAAVQAAGTAAEAAAEAAEAAAEAATEAVQAAAAAADLELTVDLELAANFATEEPWTLEYF